MVVDVAAAAVELDSRIAMADLEVKELGVMLASAGLGQVEELGADSSPSVGGFDKQFINPSALAAVFQAVVETDHKVGDWPFGIPDQAGYTVGRALKQLRQVGADRVLAEGLRPRIGLLHFFHQ